MSPFDDPTPCPAPRHGLTSINMPNSTTALFTAVKPRRPRQSRLSTGWDPSIDIFDDTTTFQFRAGAKLSQKIGSLEAPPLLQSQTQDRLSLLTQPAQRPRREINSTAGRLCIGEPQPDRQYESSHAGPRLQTNYKRRHTSSIFVSLDTEAATDLENTEHKNHSLHNSTFHKNPRRRTIYVPSDDTTILTIHPGASMAGKMFTSKKPRRSDVFLDLAALSEEEIEKPENFYAQPRGPRKSLAVAPRRGPLQVSTNMNQVTAFAVDIPGSGLGKENVPPGSFKTIRKAGSGSKMDCKIYPASDSQTSMAATVRPRPTGAESGTSAGKMCQQPRRASTMLDSFKINHRRDTHAAITYPADLAKKRFFCDSSASLSDNHPERVAAPVGSDHNGRANSIVLGKAPKKLSAPLVNCVRQARLETFPVLAEDISKPEMYEDNWLSHQEIAISQLLNGLFKKAFDCEGIMSSKIDDPRNEMLKIYNDASSSLLYKRLQASLLYGALSIPSETLNKVVRIKEDIAQRRRFLDLWLRTYDLSYLQAAAEVVTGRQVQQTQRRSNESSSPTGPSVHHASIKTIEAFLKTFLVYNEDKNAQSTPSEPSCSILTDTITDVHAAGWRRTVLRSLMLVLLLDKVHSSTKLHRRLFQLSSPYKSSVAVLQGLSKLLLPSIGDITRVLGHLDYRVQHVQYPLQEYDYVVENIATSLRDGVILTRLVEILLYPPANLDVQQQDSTLTLPSSDILSTMHNPDQETSWVLSQHLKYPCMGRTQKVYNVQLAISALHGVKGLETTIQAIRAEDIVDGHREKTLGLLWALVGRWGLQTLVDFSMLEREILRLERKWLRTNEEIPRMAYFLKDAGVEPPFKDCLERFNHLLGLWAQKIGRNHGLQVSNLSTSFADGNVFLAIMEEYRPCLAVDTATSIKSRENSLPEALRRLGCSNSFIGLFQGNNVMPSPQTVVPQLAFLASRFLSAAINYHAAITLQRCWRCHIAATMFRKRLALARLANACATVVQTRERIVWAATTLQKRWKQLLLARPRHERPP